jgi:hypothetical protein
MQHGGAGEYRMSFEQLHKPSGTRIWLLCGCMCQGALQCVSVGRCQCSSGGTLVTKKKEKQIVINHTQQGISLCHQRLGQGEVEQGGG